MSEELKNKIKEEMLISKDEELEKLTIQRDKLIDELFHKKYLNYRLTKKAINKINNIKADILFLIKYKADKQYIEGYKEGFNDSKSEILRILNTLKKRHKRHKIKVENE